MFRASLLLCMFVLPLFAEEKKPTVADLAWLTGNWKATVGETETEENWTTPKGGLMLGTNRTVKGKKAFFEFLRIADTETGVVYYASPMGKAVTEFPLKSLEKEKVVFENPKHDFPQRVIYRLADGKLHARIEGTASGKERSQEWTWEK